MQHVSCDQYPVVGWLIHNSLEMNRRIHHTTLILSSKGRINVYYHEATFILECDTDGDHNPNEYFFFNTAEKEAIYDMIEQMQKRLGMENGEKTHALVEHALRFISTDFAAD